MTTRKNNIPAYTILNDITADEPHNEKNPPIPSWQNMYNSNINTPPLHTESIPDYATGWGTSHDNSYDTLTAPHSIPQIPSSYNESIYNNAEMSERNAKYNLQSLPSTPLPSFIDLPSHASPPYGTPYPSTNYSAYDGALANASGHPKFYNIPGVPLATHPSLQDARSSNGVAMGTSMADGNRETRNSKEYYPTCPESIHHISSCVVCSRIINGEKKILQIVVVGLFLVIFILMFILFRKSF
jgi:hypothetical protein